MKSLTRFAIFSLFSAASALGQPAAVAQVDKVAIEAYLRRLEMWVPDVSVKIDDPKPNAYANGYSELTVHLSYNGQGKDERYYISTDGKRLFKGEPFDLTRSPFQANIDKLTLDKQPSFGGVKPTVNIVVFADFQCPYCKAEAEILRTKVTQTFPDAVRIYFKDFPLESIHPWARAGSVAGRCVYRQSATRFWDFHDWIYKGQSEITADNLREKVVAWATEAKLDAPSLGACIDTKATNAEVNASMAEARSLGINATPTVFLNGNKFEGSLEWPVMEQLIKFELEYQAKTAPKLGPRVSQE
jgi:protein-disulfide isomerase